MTNQNSSGSVLSVACDKGHNFSKPTRDSITLVAGLGVEGDAHFGKTVQHLARIKIDPDVPNLRQGHLIHAELHEELKASGYNIKPGEMGENITTQGINLLELPRGTVLIIGNEAQIEITGLRNPCRQLNDFKDGLMQAVLDKDEEGNLIRKSGVMGVVKNSGPVRAGDQIQLELPAGPHVALERV